MSLKLILYGHSADTEALKMAQAGKITERFVKKLKAPERGHYIEYDDLVPGFGVRITANDVVSFVLNYRMNGRERRYTIGRYPEESALSARNKSLQLRRGISEGTDPLDEKERQRGEPLVADLANDYLERHAVPHKRAGSVRNDRGILKNIVLPRLGRLRVTAVGRRDIESLHNSLKGTPYHANRVLSLLSKMFSLAIHWRWCSENPAHGIERYQEDKRDTWLTEEQLDALDKALNAYSDPGTADAIRLLMLTGAREAEVLNASWDHFDLRRGLWTKPSHHTKQRKVEHVPLSAASLAVLTRMHSTKTGTYLFPGADGKSPRVTVQKPWKQVCKAAGLATEEKIAGKRRMLVRYKPTIRLHDLRHTFASHLVSAGESLHVVGKLLGHTQPQTTARYAHLADAALRDAANKFGQLFLGKRGRRKPRQR